MGPGWPLLGESCQPSGSCTAIVTLTPVQVAPPQWGDGPKNPSPDVQEGALRAEQSFPSPLGSRCRGQGLHAQTVPRKPCSLSSYQAQLRIWGPRRAIIWLAGLGLLGRATI